MRAPAINAFVVSSKDLMKAGRWDVAFHALAKQHHAEASQIEDRLSKVQATTIAVETFETLPAIFRQAIAPLTRTQQRGNPGKDSLLSALREYPFLALAVFQSLEDEIRTHFESEIANLQTRRDRLLQGTLRASNHTMPKED
ncbi:MAG: hypothetical protein CL949_10135 [Erythrobacter sp.]|nr:hypothetical protein [Erythrobacter sp.]